MQSVFLFPRLLLLLAAVVRRRQVLRLHGRLARAGGALAPLRALPAARRGQELLALRRQRTRRRRDRGREREPLRLWSTSSERQGRKLFMAIPSVNMKDESYR